MKYNDYPDKYPSAIIEKLNLAYSNNAKASVLKKSEDFFNSKVSALVDKSVQIAGESKCELESTLVNLIESLNTCERYLFELGSRDKKNKKQISSLIKTTQNNKVQIADCCYEKYDISCDYYATWCPSFSLCCANYCCAEIDLIEQMWGFCSCDHFPINRHILLELIGCRLGCLKHVVTKYALMPEQGE